VQPVIEPTEPVGRGQSGCVRVRGAPDVQSSTDQAAVAIIGMACTYPGARTVSQFWENILNKVDAVTEVTPDRWDPDIFYDPDPATEDRLYCKKGGWIGGTFAFNPLKYGVMPSTIDGAEPDHFLVLRTVDEALADAGYSTGKLDGARVSVILGKGNYLGPGVTGLMYRGIVTEQTLAIIRGLHPDISEHDLSQMRTAIRSSLARMSAEVAPGLIPNICTGRVANRLDFMGRNFTIDAACASSLVATELGLQGLWTGQDDLVLAGGVHIFAQIPFLQVFDAMRAVSLTSTIRPFDEHADGTICGEGIGVLVLKRLADAERDGDRIYALVRAAASASDGRAKSVTAPRVEGEELALRRAYQSSGISPDTVELIEAHGTGTPVGDAAEIDALQRAFGHSDEGRPTCAIGSVKSMIGHAMPAAGAAGLIKAALALHQRVLPPTLHCETPRAALTAPTSRFYVNTETRPWIHGRADAPRRAGVNAFGFGGINAHVVLEEYVGPRARVENAAKSWNSEVVLIDGETRSGLLAAIERIRAYADRARGVPLRDLAATLNCAGRSRVHVLAVVASSPEDLSRKLVRAGTRLADASCRQIKDRTGIYYAQDGAVRQGQVAFLFPGEGSQHVEMLSELCVHFSEVRRAFDLADRAASEPGRRPTSAIVFPPAPGLESAAASLWSIDRATEAVLAADAGVLNLIDALGVVPDMMAGHSAGEWVAMAAAGIVDRDEFVASLGKLSAIHRRLDADATIPRMCMLAAGAGRETVESLAQQIHARVEFANDNCPHQVVIVVAPEDEAPVLRELRSRGVYVEKLPYERGYHSPSFDCVRDPLREYFSTMNIRASRIPLYSCATAERYPEDRREIIELLSSTFARPLMFRQTVETMYEAGARIFVEAGPSGHLSAFVDDILRGRPHLTVPMDQSSRAGLTALNHAIGMLAANGVPLDLAWLYERRSARTLALNPEADGLDEDAAPGTVKVSVCYPRLQPPLPAARYASLVPVPSPPAAVPLSPRLPAVVNGASQTLEAPAWRAVAAHVGGRGSAAAAMEAHSALMEEFLSTQEAVMVGYWQGVGGTRARELTRSAAAPAAVLEGNPARSTMTTVVSPPAVSVPPSPSGPVDEPSVTAVLLRVVSDRTGYPIDMLGLDLDLEADLGIDSIKRVEIFSALQQSGHETVTDSAMEDVAKLKTLREIVAFFLRVAGGVASGSTKEDEIARDAEIEFGPLTRTAKVVDRIQNESLTIECDISTSEHLYLRDHCLYHLPPGRQREGGLVSMPMTCTLEMMAETAAALCPGLKVVGARDIKALRWINFERPAFRATVSIAARRADTRSVRVVVRSATNDCERSAPEVLASATILFGERYPAPPTTPVGPLSSPRTPVCKGADVYTSHLMFHGPSFHGVTAIDAIGDDGVQGRVTALPNDRVLASTTMPRFHLDPFLLDAAGQLVGYWPSEFMSEGHVVLPIGISEITLYGNAIAPGTALDCRVRMRDKTHRSISADLDVLGSDEKPVMRILGWEDWRFYWDKHIYDFWRFPDANANGLRVEISGHPEIECRRIVPMSEMDNSGLWETLWMHMILSPSEIDECRRIAEPDARRSWLVRRAAAKDAVRGWIRRETGRNVWATDVQVTEEAEGAWRVNGDWAAAAGVPLPHVAVAVSPGGAVAVASPTPVAVSLDVADAVSAAQL
jgi:acyl transferase domain-containing protein